MKRAPILILVLSLVGCQPSTQQAEEAGGWPRVSGAPATNLTAACVEVFDPAVDYFPDKVTPRYAERYQVTYHGHYKVLRANVAGSEWGPEVSDTVVLVQCGTPPPLLEGDLAEAVIVEVPIRSMASNEDGSVARTDALGHVDRVAGLAGGGIYNATLRQRWDDGDLISVGQSFHGAPNFEMLLTDEPGVVFLFTSSLDHAEAVDHGRDLGLATVPIVGWAEPTILGQAEWVKHTALFLNAEAEANAYFDGVAQR